MSSSYEVEVEFISENTAESYCRMEMKPAGFQRCMAPESFDTCQSLKTKTFQRACVESLSEI